MSGFSRTPAGFTRTAARLVVPIILTLAMTGAVLMAAPDSPRLEAAKDLIADEQWSKAVDELRGLIGDPSEPAKDEVTFWLAHSLNQAGQPDDALKTIEELEKKFPKSRWLKPARSLRIEIAQRLGRSDLLWSEVGVPAPAPPAPPAAPAPPAPGAAPPAAPPTAPAPPAPAAPATPAPPAAPAPPAPRSRMSPRAGRDTEEERRLREEERRLAREERDRERMAARGERLDKDEELKIEVLNALVGSNSEEAIDMLAQIVKENKQPRVTKRALFVLAQSRSARARSLLVDVARSGPEELRPSAVQQLGLFGGPEAGKELMNLYAAGTPAVRRQVVNSLMIRGDRAALAQIARTETDPHVRDFAINQLGVVGGPEAGKYLMEIYSSGLPEVRRKVANSLMIRGDRAGLAQIARTDKDVAVRDFAINQLGVAGGRAELTSLYGSAAPDMKRRIINALFIARGDEELIAIAKTESDADVRAEAVQKLGLIGSARARQYLIELLKKGE